MPSGQSFLTQAAGAYFTNQTLSRQLRAVAQPLARFRQFCRKDPQFGKRSGQKLLFNILANIGADPSTGAIIAEGQPIPRDGFQIFQRECIAIPSGQGIPWTEEFESMSEFEVRDPIESRAVDHMAKALDYRASIPFRQAEVVYAPTGSNLAPTYSLLADATGGAITDRNVTLFDVKNISDIMRSGRYNFDGGTVRLSPVPPYDGMNLMCVGSVQFCRALKEDSQWQNAQYYGDPEKLFSGEVGRIYGVRVVEENHIMSTLPTITGFGGEAVFFGDDPAIECVVTPEEVRIDLPRDFGRDMAMAWYYLGGFARTITYTGTSGIQDNRIIRLYGT